MTILPRVLGIRQGRTIFRVRRHACWMMLVVVVVNGEDGHGDDDHDDDAAAAGGGGGVGDDCDGSIIQAFGGLGWLPLPRMYGAEACLRGYMTIFPVCLGEYGNRAWHMP